VTTAELIARGARRFRDRTAVLCGDESLTFAEVNELANRVAHVLLERGHDRVGLRLANSLHSIPVDFACAKAGIARVPLNPRLAEAEQRAILETAGCETVVADDDGSLAELLERAAGAPAGEPPVEVTADTTLLLLPTSGTTGRLKLVRHTQGSYAAIVANILANLLDPRRDDVMLHAASLIHASGTFVLPYWLRGGASAVLPGFAPGAFLDAAERYGATATNAVPTMLGALLGEPPRDLPRLRTIVYGASPMPRADRALPRPLRADPRAVLRPDGGAALHHRPAAGGPRRGAASLLRPPGGRRRGAPRPRDERDPGASAVRGRRLPR
jgi:acyl-CoA synthetase (AMP-forming)/AMP-acid ligase II